MLVLTRKVEQEIIIEGGIRVKVLDIERGGRVKLGIEAPESVGIWRAELKEMQDKEKAE
jgi:carbon storage regulator CsrA